MSESVYLVEEQQEYVVTYNFNGVADQWLVEDAPRKAAVTRYGSKQLYCWECSAGTCVHVQAVWKWMENQGWFEEVNGE